MLQILLALKCLCHADGLLQPFSGIGDTPTALINLVRDADFIGTVPVCTEVLVSSRRIAAAILSNRGYTVAAVEPAAAGHP